jgi:UDP-N-acetylglucosamine diphosphorylase/glucosamine-1-phosphate N-acetyltransferase
MIFIYEDDRCGNLLPLVYFRPVFDLLCGRRTLLDKFRARYPGEKFGLLVRPQIAELTAESHPDDGRSQIADCRMPSGTPALFISGRVILEARLPAQGREEVFVCGSQIVAFRVDPSRVKSLPIAQSGVRAWGLPERKVLASIVSYPWDLIAFNEAELTRELGRARAERTQKGRRKGAGNAGVAVIGNPGGLYVARSAKVQPGVVFDLTLGRVHVGERAEIRAGSVVAGPGYVGKGTIIDAARIRPGCSFGPNCRIGGEVEASIFLGHANKHHEGFIGHSVIGEWVNLGALTTNSDLRNDYGEVKVIVRGRAVNTRMRKVGCIIGDHAKTAIGTLLNTGAVMGIFANWFEPGLSPKAIADFAWGGKGRWPLDQGVETGRIVMARRGVTMSKAYEKLIRSYYAQSR